MTVRSILVNIAANPAQLVAGYRTAAAATGRFAAQTATMQTGLQGAQGTARGLGGTIGGLTPKLIGAGSLAYGAKQVADAGLEWESAFAGVTKTVEGTPEQLGRINDGLKDMSTTIPTSKEDLAGIAESAGQLGIETDNVLGFTGVIADLGETTNLTGEQGATMLAQFANITQMDQGNFDRLGSTIVDLGNNSATTESDIANMAQRVAAAGAQAGMSEADILGISAALASVGIEAESGGSAVTRTITEIGRQVETGGDKLATFAETAGMAPEQFAEAWRTDAAGAFDSFITGLGNIEESGGSVNGVLEELEITELRQSDALRRLAGNSDGLTSSLDLASDAWETNNALQEEAAQRYETTEAKMQIAKNAVGNLATEIGENLLPIIGEAATGLTDLLSTEIPGGGGANVTDAIAGGAQWLMSPGAAIEGQIQARADAAAAAQQAILTAEESHRAQSREVFGMGAVDTSGMDAYTDRLQGLADMYGVAQDAADPLTRSLADNTEMLEAQAATAAASQEALAGLADEERAATDPMFALKQAVSDVDAAQRTYTEAVEEHGPKSAEATDAAWQLAEAQAGLEQAVLNGDLSIDQAIDTINRWEEQGYLSAEAARTLRGDVRKLGDTAADVKGTYWVRMKAETDTAADRIRTIRGLIGSIPTSVTTTVGVSYTSQGEAALNIPGRGRYLIGEPRASGGMAYAGSPYIVGEDGPEMFVPGSTGYVHDRNATEAMLAGPRTSTISTSTVRNEFNLYGERVSRTLQFDAMQLARAYP